jgi:cytochrome o ubiquinol oxidase subunit II
MSKRLRMLALLPLAATLAACKAVVLNPSGDIARQQRDLLIISTELMLLIIVPVMALTVFFAWRYRHTNSKARYEPDWHHSMRLELAIWSAPLLIVICLGALTWLSTHLLDPYRPLGRIASGRAAPANVQPLEVDVVALDWKWLFIYPQYGVASVNELALPIDQPISMHITSSTVMNALYIPELAGQVYAMPGMETQLHAVLNKAGTSEGFSSNYSGAGFSGMHFKMRGLEPADFDRWLARARSQPEVLTRGAYLTLAKPSENDPVRHYGAVDTQLYASIVGMCVQTGTSCMHEMLASHPAHQDASDQTEFRGRK